MTNKKYKLYLDGNSIGYTHLEKSDASMGVVFGQIYFEGLDSPYKFLIDYCNKNKIEINYNDPKLKLIDTQALEGLKVLNPPCFQTSSHTIMNNTIRRIS